MLDQLYHRLLAGSDDYGQLWSIVKMVLHLLHGCGWRNSEPEQKETGIVNWRWFNSLTASADQLAEKAESSCDMSILVISTAMHKVCKEKAAEMTELDKQLV